MSPKGLENVSNRARMEAIERRFWQLVAAALMVSQLQSGASAQETRPGATTAQNFTSFAINSSNLFDQERLPRIVGGKDTEEGRYPYFVSLLNEFGIHSCGGTLVAPDVVISAAHCADSVKYAQVGRWQEDTQDDYEEFDIAFPIQVHPLYEAGISFSHDIMLIKLNRQSTKKYLRINEDPNLPTGEQPNELTAIGIGYTKQADASSVPQVLQEVSLTYVPNYICERSKDPSIVENYQGLVSEDMLCASDDGEDACQGDSGGPLILSIGTGIDLLVGVVSWGFGCANPSFPGVYSRVSYHSLWTKATLCEISRNPPTEYDCANVALPSVEDSVPVTIVFQFDDHPGEVTWSLVRKETETVLVSVGAGTYKGAQSSAQETVFLPRGSNIVFNIQDQYGDGLCCDPPGNYRVVLGRNSEGQILVSGGGDFGHEKSHYFQVPSSFIDDQEKANLAEGEIPLTVVVQLDGFPQEVGWRIDHLGVQIEEVVRIPSGIYSTPHMKVIRTVILQQGELYYFSLYDMTQNGIENGNVQLILGTPGIQDSSQVILESDGNFGAGVDHTFIAALGDVPTIAPVVTSEAHLTLLLRLDLYPAEISVQLRMHIADASAPRQTDREDAIVFFQPPGYYRGMVNEVVRERIAIPVTNPGAIRTFTFIITDRYGDGLCCASSGGLETGYTIYEGDLSSGRLIVQSKFENSGREVKVFNIASDEVYGTDSEPQKLAEPNVVVKVTISLDIYPDETGFYIEDANRRRVVNVPPGTYFEQNEIVTEVVTLEKGLYTFTIVDVFGDGLNRADGFYKLEVISQRNQLPLVSGTGAFAFRESQTFLLEGDAARYPMSIAIPTGAKPQDFGFSIYRLDLVEADALVASKVRGSYQYANAQIRENLEITEGGLYRVVFENTGEGVVGGVRIILGSSSPNEFNGIEYTLSPENTQNSQRWQLKFYAGTPSSPPANSLKRLTLRVRFDRFPNEIEWILVAIRNLPFQSKRHIQAKQEVVAFGPAVVYNPDLSNAMYQETIFIPDYAGNTSFTLIVTDSGKDGLCCSFGVGGPLELYDGTPEEGFLVFSDPLQGEERLIANFFIIGSASSALACPWPIRLIISISATLLFS